MTRDTERWQPAARLAAISFLTLFAEVAFIRWLSTETRFFAFYKNMALISCFVGLGGGATLGKNGSGRRWFVIALAAFALLIHLTGPQLIYLHPPAGDEFVWLPQNTEWQDGVLFYGAFALFFALNTLVFFFGGQAVGAAFAELPSLRAYSANLLGSMAGVVVFTAVSYLQLGPAAWLSIALLVGLAIEWREGPALRAAVVGGVLLFFWLAPDTASWSPYSRITVQPASTSNGDPWGVNIETNGMYHLRAVDLSEGFVKAHEAQMNTDLAAPLIYYGLPYHFARPKRVLVIGAGGGNDVAAAIRAGADEITAVEIDPAIAAAGKRWHPEHPYDSPRVKLVVDDGRAFLSRGQGVFDLIVFGLVDSHSVVASMGHVRLDNFLYTRESMELAKKMLAPGGLVSISFSSGYDESWWTLRRIELGLLHTFGKPPVILDATYDRGFVFLAGPGAPATLSHPIDLAQAASAKRKFSSAQAQEESELTDDWPFMYLRGRWIPAEYLVIFALVIALSALMISNLVPNGLRAADPYFFLLGAGFFLVEVRNLAELSLLFGSTWVVNAFVILGVLTMALLANLTVARWSIPPRLAFALLMLAVGSCVLSPVAALAGQAPAIRMVLGTLVLSLPFFFSGIVFSSAFKDTPSASVAFGSNLLGAVVGGLLENASLIHGIRSLSLFALVVYGLAFLVLVRRGQPAVAMAGAAAKVP